MSKVEMKKHMHCDHKVVDKYSTHNHDNEEENKEKKI